MKNAQIKQGVYKVLCPAVKSHGHALVAQIIIMQNLQVYEHLAEPMAELLVCLAKEFDHTQLGDEILREVAAKGFSAQDPKGPRTFSKFLVKMAQDIPRAVLKQFSLLLNHLDSEACDTLASASW
jgi:condensin complex subunit 1